MSLAIKEDAAKETENLSSSFNFIIYELYNLEQISYAYKTVFPYPQNGSIETHPTYVTCSLYSSDKMMHEAVLLTEKTC